MLHLPVKLYVRNQLRYYARWVNPDSWNMPRSRNHIGELQEARRKQKNKRMDKSDGPAYLQIIGSGAIGAPRSLYFFTDYCRYIFNVGEGTQRLAHEHKVKLTRLEHVFITQSSWKNVGGLLGFSLTLQEGGVPEIALHGPRGLEKLYEASDRFVFLNNLKIRPVECCRGTMFSDPMVTIIYVPLLPPKEDCNIDNKKDIVKCKIPEFSEEQDPIQSSTPNGSSDFSSAAISYICKMKDKLGRLNLESCVEKNVPPGPLLGKLKSGLDVTLADGTLVRAIDVKDPDEPGAVFIIVDCPSENYLDSLLGEKLFKNYQLGAKSEDIPKYIIHFTPPSIIRHEKYQKWLDRFDKSISHVNINEDNKCMGNVGAHELQTKLNLLDPFIFPLLKDDSLQNVTESILSEDEELEALLNKTKSSEFKKRTYFNYSDHEGNTLRCLPLRDERYVGKVPDCVYTSTSKFIAEVTERNEFQEKMKTFRSNLQFVKPYYPDREYPRVTFLGTGSCIPNKYRNATAILVSLANDNHMIFDCGEGTYGQLIRHFGLTRTTEILSRTNVIFVSHIHADHHLGFFNLLHHRKEAVKNVDDAVKKLVLIAPKTMHFWLNKYRTYFDNVFEDLDFIDCQYLEYRSKSDTYLAKVKSVAPLEDINLAYVVHCPSALGISITHVNGTKITYSGDTMPAKSLVTIGMNSNLLIHEATFEDDLIREARSKLHSTFNEAIEMGEKMRADFTVLTHFSQRYSKVPIFNDRFHEKVGVAFDNMEICLNDLPKLHLFNPILGVIFEEDIEEMELRTHKRRKLALYEEQESDII